MMRCLQALHMRYRQQCHVSDWQTDTQSSMIPDSVVL